MGRVLLLHHEPRNALFQRVPILNKIAFDSAYPAHDDRAGLLQVMP